MVREQRLFIGSILALIATSFGFGVRAVILGSWGAEFGLTQTQLGVITGVGLAPFAITIILFSLVIDKIGYGISIRLAFAGHILSTILLLLTGSVFTGFWGLYVGTLVFALANGIVEAVINPATATLFPHEKTHKLNILHAGWPAGIILGAATAIMFQNLEFNWRWSIGALLVPAVIYGVMVLNEKWPTQERAAAGVSYKDMLREFGAASCFIAGFLLVVAVLTIIQSTGGIEAKLSTNYLISAVVALVIGAAFYAYARSLGRPLFIVLLLIMMPLAITELGTDSWITNLMAGLIKGGWHEGWVLVYTSVIMFILRFYAGPLVHVLNPLGLLAFAAAIACLGLIWLSSATGWGIVLAATVYGIGKAYFWPTMLGTVAEQSPKGGALNVNAIAGVGMLTVGILGNPMIGAVQDRVMDQQLQAKYPEIHSNVTEEEQRFSLLGPYYPVVREEVEQLPEVEQSQVQEVRGDAKQNALSRIAILPAIMFVAYLILLGYFRAKGGYKPVQLTQTRPPESGGNSGG